MTPIVLVPGLLCTDELFTPQIPALWPYGPITISSTLEGDTIAEMAAAILRSAPPTFALLGISMGGYISFEIMRQAPQRVLKLALLDTTVRPDSPEQAEGRQTMLKHARGGHFDAMLEPALTSIMHPDNRERLKETVVKMGRTIGPDHFIRQTQAVMDRIDSRSTLTSISVPTLVLVGEQDPLTPPDKAMEMAGEIKNSKLVVVPDCGHSSTLEQPEAVNSALVEWLSA